MNIIKINSDGYSYEYLITCLNGNEMIVSKSELEELQNEINAILHFEE